MTKVHFLRVLLATVTVIVAASSAKASELQSCLGSIKAYGDSLSQRTDLNPLIMRGIFNLVNDKYNNGQGLYDSQPTGAKPDFLKCEGFGLSYATIKTVMSLDTEQRFLVFDSLAQCNAAMIRLAPKIEATLSHAEATKLGNIVGKGIADAQIVISYALRLRDLTRQMISDEGRRRVAASPSEEALDEWLRGCNRIGIDLQPTIEQLSKNRSHADRP